MPHTYGPVVKDGRGGSEVVYSCKWQAPRALSVLDLAMVAPVFLSWFRGGMGSREMCTCSPHTWVTEAKNLLDSPVPGKPGQYNN